MIRSESGLFNCICSCASTESFLGPLGKPCCTRHWWDEDVVAFETKLNALKNSAGDPANVGIAASAFLEKKKEGVEAITEVSPTCVDVKASSIIVCSSMAASV